MSSKALRTRYADLICKEAHVSSAEVRQALTTVRRETFFPPGPWWIYQFEPTFPYFSYTKSKSSADDILYANVSVAIDPDTYINSGLPSVIASWLEILHLRKGAHVFQIGCGFGYYTAAMAELVGRGGHVLAVEVREDIAAVATKNLRAWPQCTVIAGDGTKVDSGPVDALIVHAGTTEIDPVWLARLRASGGLVFPLTFIDPRRPELGLGVAFHVKRHHAGFQAQFMGTPYITTCTSLRSTSGEEIKDALDKGGWADVKELRTDHHAPTDSCWLHKADWCLSTRGFEPM